MLAELMRVLEKPVVPGGFEPIFGEASSSDSLLGSPNESLSLPDRAPMGYVYGLRGTERLSAAPKPEGREPLSV